MTFAPVAIGDLLDAAADVLRPLEPLSPSAWAERHRVVEGGPFAGRWDNANGPHLVALMDAVQEAIETGRHLVVIKGAQEGVTEALGVNAVAWLLTFYGGPVLYLTSKDDVAKEVVHDRWRRLLETCEPLARKHLAGKSNNEQILVKRFTDGKLTLSGSKSLLNFLSAPFAVVVFDELDSCQDAMPDGSDPVALVLERLTAYAEGRPVLVIAFAHPTTKTRGAAKLYYTESDQRRAHVACPHCGTWVAPLWTHVRPIPRDGQAPAAAERDPSSYVLATPCCGAVWSDADRLRAIERVEQRSTLPPEVARGRRWIGCHVWHLFLRRAGRIEELAGKYIDGLDDEGRAIVWANKVLGDAYEVDLDERPDEEAWRACVTLPRADGDPASYYRGEVPSEVAVLTAGVDASSTAIHWTVWGWGYLPAHEGGRVLCGWLVEWGEVRRDPPVNGLDAADLRPLDALLYDRRWLRRDGIALEVLQGGHDSGWEPTAVYAYVSRRPGRAVAIKGGSDDDRSLAPLLRWGKRPRVVVRGVEIKDQDERLAVVNTFLAKKVFFGRVRRRFHLAARGPLPDERDRWRLHLPVDVDDELVRQLSAERLARRRGRLVWKRLGPNHYGDCSVYSFALAEGLGPALERAGGARRTAGVVGSMVEGETEAAGPERPRWKIGR